MPIYEYRCAECGQTFEALRRMSDADRDVICPECQSDRVERMISGFATGGCGSGAGTGGGASRGRFR